MAAAGNLSGKGGTAENRHWADGVLTWQREVSLQGGLSIQLRCWALALDIVFVHVEFIVPLEPHAPARAAALMLNTGW